MKILVVSNKNSKRVSLVPNDINRLITNGIEVYVTNNTTNLCGFSKNDYITAGAKIIEKLTAKFIKTIDIISFIDFPKDKIILNSLSCNQILWGFMYLVNNPKHLFLAIKNNLTTIAIETINSGNVYEYFLPMEQIKGEYVLTLSKKAIKKYDNTKKYKNKNINQTSLVKNNILILNYSYSGYYATKTALSNGYNILYLENDKTLSNELKVDKELKSLANLHNCHFDVIEASYDNLCDKIKDTNILICTNQLPTIKTQLRITKNMINSMVKGSVYINFATETGFASATEIKPTTIYNPCVIHNGICHISIENINDIFPKKSSEIISNLNTKNFLILKKNQLYCNLLTTENKFKNAIMTYNHCLTNKEIASSLHLKYTNIETIKKI